MDSGAASINTAFAGDATLRKRIFNAINETPQHATLFADIAHYQLSNARPLVVSDGVSNQRYDSPSKKRKIDENDPGLSPKENQPREVILEARDISFSLPQRKKFHLSIVQYGRDFNDASTTFALCGRNPATNQVEFELSVQSFAYALRVPVPEKAQKQYNFCLLPPASGPEATSAAGEGIIWTVNHGPLKSCHINNPDLEKLVGTTDVLEKSLDAILQRTGSRLVFPSEAHFASAVAEAHRRNEKAYHVKAHRGSKDGYLFFLENGIFFGFKKPLAFFPFHEIEAVSYTNVLQRTFNLAIAVRTSLDTEPQEIEFSMLDQVDFAGIDAYIKKHHLQDASLAEARRAKQYKVNGKSSGTSAEEADESRTELEKAEAELEDEEDELEEDYDPGSDGESEGSGSSEDDDDGYTEEGDTNLVKDELGSEAEDVEIIDEEEDEASVHDNHEAASADDKDEDRTLTEKPAGQAISRLPRLPNGAPDLDDEDQL